MRRIAWWAAGTGGVVLLLAGAAASFLLLGSLPRLSGEVRVAGLTAEATIGRDAFAVPHITAANARDAYLALGFAHAQDRLWQMEVNRRLAQGRLAEVLGAPALSYDRLTRTLGLARLAEASFGHLNAEARRHLEAYASGVNAFLATNRWPLPPEFVMLRHRPEPWRPADSLLLLRLMALDLGVNWRQEVLRARLALRLTAAQLADLWPDQPPATPVTMAALRDLPLERLAAAFPAPGPATLGSNVWVAAGSRTRSGKPLLANDPHLGLSMPGLWYLAQLAAPDLAVAGATIPGVPFVVLGRNRDVAWGFTNTGSDTQDLFIERVVDGDPGRYLVPGGTAPFRRRSETIAVRGETPVRLEVRTTRHGPVISDVVASVAAASPPGHVLALAWTALLEPDRTAETGFAAARARTSGELRAAFSRFAAPPQNVAHADRAGSIGLLSPGLVPIRREGDGRLPVPGWTGAHDWQGTIPAEAAPRTVDPATGLLVNANNQLVGPDYPYFLTADWDAGLRARRLSTLLEGRDDLDVAAFAAMQLDQHSTLAHDFLPLLLEAPLPDPRLAGLRDRLRDWDRRMRGDAREPLLFAAWFHALGGRVWGDELGPLAASYGGFRPDFLRHVLERRRRWCDDVTSPGVESCANRAAAALSDAVALLESRLGADWQDRTWAELHPALLAHRPFDLIGRLRWWFSREVPKGGDGSTIDVAHFASDEPFVNRHGPGYRAIYDLADPDGSRVVTSTGQSGHPLSRHYDDLTELWRRGNYLTLRLSAPEVTYRLLLRPPVL